MLFTMGYTTWVVKYIVFHSKSIFITKINNKKHALFYYAFWKRFSGEKKNREKMDYYIQNNLLVLAVSMQTDRQTDSRKKTFK